MAQLKTTAINGKLSVTSASDVNAENSAFYCAGGGYFVGSIYSKSTINALTKIITGGSITVNGTDNANGSFGDSYSGQTASIRTKGGLAVSKDAQIAGYLGVLGNAVITGSAGNTLEVNGQTKLYNDLEVTGDVYIQSNKTLNIEGGPLYVNKIYQYDDTLGSYIECYSPLSINGNLAVSDGYKLLVDTIGTFDAAEVTFTNGVTVEDTFHCSSSGTFESNLKTEANLEVDGNISVGGNVEIDSSKHIRVGAIYSPTDDDQISIGDSNEGKIIVGDNYLQAYSIKSNYEKGEILLGYETFDTETSSGYSRGDIGRVELSSIGVDEHYANTSSAQYYTMKNRIVLGGSEAYTIPSLTDGSYGPITLIESIDGNGYGFGGHIMLHAMTSGLRTGGGPQGYPGDTYYDFTDDGLFVNTKSWAKDNTPFYFNVNGSNIKITYLEYSTLASATSIWVAPSLGGTAVAFLYSKTGTRSCIVSMTYSGGGSGSYSTWAKEGSWTVSRSGTRFSIKSDSSAYVGILFVMTRK